MSYPNDTGWKGEPGGIGQQAACAFNPKRPTRKAEALIALGELGTATAVQVADRLGRHWFHVAPRLSELLAEGLVKKIDRAGRSAFGQAATVYAAASPEEVALFLARKAASDEKGEANG
jgi:predicted ArsR family transcriptional regulator